MDRFPTDLGAPKADMDGWLVAQLRSTELADADVWHLLERWLVQTFAPLLQATDRLSPALELQQATTRLVAAAVAARDPTTPELADAVIALALVAELAQLDLVDALQDRLVDLVQLHQGQKHHTAVDALVGRTRPAP